MRSHLFFAAVCCAAVGCATTKSTDTARTATEQLLISNAVDDALDKVDFRPMAGQRIFLQEKYVDCVDKSYVVSSVRHRLLAGGAQLVEAADKADIILEVRTGAVGTDRVNTFFGVPEISMPGPIPVALPEVRLVSRESQFGTAKIGLFAYDAKTNEVLGDGGMSLARADENNWFFLGMGPWKSGSVKKSIGIANEERATPGTVPNHVALRAPSSSPNGLVREKVPTKVLPASGEGPRPMPLQ